MRRLPYWPRHVVCALVLTCTPLALLKLVGVPLPNGTILNVFIFGGYLCLGSLVSVLVLFSLALLRCAFIGSRNSREEHNRRFFAKFEKESHK